MIFNMNPKELRIGNLFQFPVKEEMQYWDICDIMTNPFEVYFTQNNQYNYSDNLHPIPLTEEWLVKCGFAVNEQGFMNFRNNRYVIVPMQNAITIFLNNIESAPNVMELITGVQYLHQLQNLYFALTGEELKINN